MMQVKKILGILIGICFLSLAACKSIDTGANANQIGAPVTSSSAEGDNDGGVVTSGIGGEDADTSGNTDLSNPNALVPGANQVYYFDYDKNDVHSSDLPSLKVQAKYLISHPNAKVLIEGNTDIRGSREYNIALGQRRANAVADILSLHGVNKNQFRTVSYGAEKPVALGHTEHDYALNRRVNMIYQAK